MNVAFNRVGAAPCAPEHPTFREAAAVWAKVAALSFGAPAGQIAVIHRIRVEETRRIAEDRTSQARRSRHPWPLAQQEFTDEVHWAYVFEPQGRLNTGAMGARGSGVWRLGGDRLCLTLAGESEHCRGLAPGLLDQSLEPELERALSIDGVLQKPPKRN